MINWKDLFDRQIQEISHPEPVFRSVDSDMERRNLEGYKVSVRYKHHTTERFFALKKATERVKKGKAKDDTAPYRKAEKRAWAYSSEMHEKMMAQRS